MEKFNKNLQILQKNWLWVVKYEYLDKFTWLGIWIMSNIRVTYSGLFFFVSGMITIFTGLVFSQTDKMYIGDVKKKTKVVSGKKIKII